MCSHVFIALPVFTLLTDTQESELVSEPRSLPGCSRIGGCRDSAERDGFLEAFELIGSGKIALGAWLFQLV